MGPATDLVDDGRVELALEALQTGRRRVDRALAARRRRPHLLTRFAHAAQPGGRR